MILIRMAQRRVLTPLTAAFLLIIGIGIAPRVFAQGIPENDTFSPLWERRVPDYVTSSIAPDGRYAAVINGAGGRVTLYQIMGKLVTPAWTKKIDAASQVTVTTGGRNVLAYSCWNPIEREITILKGSDGTVVSRTTLDGAIWAVTASSDGCFAGVVTGNDSLYVFTLGNRPVYHRWNITGVGNSVSFLKDSTGVVAGTWDESGATCYSRGGNVLWEYPLRIGTAPVMDDRLFEVHAAQNADYVLALSYANIRQGYPTLYLFRGDGDGVPLWSRSLGDGTFYPRASITPDGRFIAVSYLSLVTSNNKSIDERRLMVLDDHNNVVWSGGGLLFTPILVSFAPDGHRITVSNGDKSLYHLDGTGHITSTWTAPGSIRDTQASDDGHLLLVYSGDGSLSLLSLIPVKSG